MQTQSSHAHVCVLRLRLSAFHSFISLRYINNVFNFRSFNCRSRIVGMFFS